jgi:hypothetical protein
LAALEPLGFIGDSYPNFAFHSFLLIRYMQVVVQELFRQQVVQMVICPRGPITVLVTHAA